MTFPDERARGDGIAAGVEQRRDGSRRLRAATQCMDEAV